MYVLKSEQNLLFFSNSILESSHLRGKMVVDSESSDIIKFGSQCLLNPHINNLRGKMVVDSESSDIRKFRKTMLIVIICVATPIMKALYDANDTFFIF